MTDMLGKRRQMKLRVTMDSYACCPDSDMRSFIACMHFARLLTVVSQTDADLVIELTAPLGCNASKWAEQTTQKFVSCGYKVEVARD